MDDKHYLINRDNFMETIQIPLYIYKKTSSQFFFALLKSILNFEHLTKKNDPHSSCISGNTSSEKHG